MRSAVLVPVLHSKLQPVSPAPTMDLDLDDSKNDPTAPSLKRHPDLWFSDGSVVLRAESTCFRVHKSQLSRQSLFFRDLFSLPQPGAMVEKESDASWGGCDGTLDGCPVLLLHDSADDVVNLLHALYDGGP